MKEIGTAGNNRKGKTWLALICVLVGLLSGCGSYFGESRPQYVDYVMDHKEETERFLKKEFGEVSIAYREGDEELCVMTDSGVIYSYRHADGIDYFKYITVQVESDEKEPGILTIDADDSYNWGDVGEKQLKLEEWVTTRQMKAYYDEGKRIESLMTECAEKGK